MNLANYPNNQKTRAADIQTTADTCVDLFSFSPASQITMHASDPDTKAYRRHTLISAERTCGYCISAGHPSRCTATVGSVVGARWAPAPQSALISHQSAPLRRLPDAGRDLPTSHPNKDVHFGSGASSHSSACTTRWRKNLMPPSYRRGVNVKKWRLGKWRSERSGWPGEQGAGEKPVLEVEQTVCSCSLEENVCAAIKSKNKYF